MPCSISQSAKCDVIRWTLAADADVFSLRATRPYRAHQQMFYRGIALVESFSDQAGVAIQSKRELGQVVRADREAVEELEKLFGQHRVRTVPRTS